MPSRTRTPTRACVHPRLEVSHPRLSRLAILRHDRARVLLEGVEQDHQASRTLIENAVAGLGEPYAQLPQIPSICDVAGNSGGGGRRSRPFRCSSMASSTFATARGCTSNNRKSLTRSFPPRSRPACYRGARRQRPVGNSVGASVSAHRNPDSLQSGFSAPCPRSAVELWDRAHRLPLQLRHLLWSEDAERRQLMDRVISGKSVHCLTSGACRGSERDEHPF